MIEPLLFEQIIAITIMATGVAILLIWTILESNCRRMDYIENYLKYKSKVKSK